MLWLQYHGYLTSAEDFYNLPHKSAFVSRQAIPDIFVSEWEQEYWASNTGYSLPSGHTLFAAEWALIMLLLLWRSKAYWLAFSIMLWAIGVEVSRLILGMHWPVDLISSCLGAAFFVWVGSLCWDRWVFMPSPNISASQSVP